MRSSKSRSRSRSNRNKPSGNIVNRVFDSSGPEGKVRGTPQQIIDKYNQLARDAQLGGDRVSTENFQQHAEHYTRLLGEAQREQEARREEQERLNRDRQSQRDKERAERNERTPEDPAQNGDPRDGASASGGRDDSWDQQEDSRTESSPPDPVSVDDADPLEAQSSLVGTPEAAPDAKPRRKTAPRKAPAQQKSTKVASASNARSKKTRADAAADRDEGDPERAAE